MKRFTCIFIFLLSCTFSVFSSEDPEIYTVPNVYKSGFRGVKSIVHKDGTIEGYLLFYRAGNKCRVVFLNTALEVKADSEIPYESNLEIGEVLFNGSEVLLTTTVTTRNGYYLSTRLYSFTYTGEKIASKTIGYSVENSADIQIRADGNGNGFYVVIPTSGGTFNIKKLNAKLEVVWERRFDNGAGFASCEATFSASDYFVFVAKKTAKRRSKRMNAELVCLNGQNGEIQFVSSLYDNEVTSLPSQIMVNDNDNIIAVGDYYKGNKQKSVKSKGIVIREYSSIGEDVAYNKLSWKKGIQKQLKKTNVSIGFKNKILFHSIVQSGSGGVQLIGETFSTSQIGGALGHMDKGVSDVASALADDETVGMIIELIAGAQRLKAFTTSLVSGRFIGNAHPEFSPGCLTIQDLVIFSFDEGLSLSDVNKISKPNYTKVYTYYPYNWYGGLRKAQTVADYGFFDYAFTQKSETGDQELLVYNASYSLKPHIGLVRIEEGVVSDVKKVFYKEITGKKNSGKQGVAGCVPAIDGNMLVYYFSEVDEVDDDVSNRKEVFGDLHFYFEKIE